MEDKDYVLVQGELFRVCEVNKVKNVEVTEESNLKLNVDRIPLNESLAIDILVDDQLDNYLVVGMINFNKNTKEVEFEDVYFRSIKMLKDLSWFDMQEYLNSVEFAVNALYDMNKINKKFELEDFK